MILKNILTKVHYIVEVKTLVTDYVWLVGVIQINSSLHFLLFPI